MEALRIGFFQFWHNVPYFLLCCAPFLPELRVSRRVLGASTVLTGLLIAAYYALRETAFPALRTYHDLILLGFYGLYYLQYQRYFRVRPARLLYVFLVVQAYSTAINVVCKFVDVRLFPGHFAKVTATSYSLMVMALMAASLPFVWRFFTGRLRTAFASLPDEGFWRFLVTPAIFFVVNEIYINLLYGRMFRETGRLDTQSLLIFLLILTAEFFIYFFLMRSAIDSARHAALAADMRSMERQLALQARSYEQLTRSIETTRAARHDLRHHLAAMAAYIERDDKEGLRAYLADYQRSLGDGGETSVCGNYAVDVVTRHYLALARSAGAALDVRLDLPQEAGVPDSDLCIVFGNLFENAALAVARQAAGPRYLTARCVAENGHIVLTVDNTTDPAALQPPSALERGVGQTSVAAVAEKYGGAVDFTLEGHVYRASVLLNIPNLEEVES